MRDQVLEQLKSAILNFDGDGAEKSARQAVEQGVDPVQALEAATDAVREIGRQYEEGNYFLPELVAGASALQRVTPIIEAEIKRQGSLRQSTGKVVIGTVFGDIHSIGKTMVATMLTAEGFDVMDLGVNVPAEEFIKAVKEFQPDIVAMSALMTMTMQEQKKVIAELQKAGLRESVKIMVGGSAINESFATIIGADGYDPTAPGAAHLARAWVSKEG